MENDVKKTAKKKTRKRTRPNCHTKDEVLSGKHHTPHKSRGARTKGVSVSVCLIVKDEEEFLDNCLASIEGIADEIIVVDTGSEDKTVEIAQKYTDKIYFHPWNDSFSEARNHYLNYATGDWIFQIDADEELIKEDIPSLMEALKDDTIDAIMVQIVSKFQNGRSEAIHSVERIFRNNGVIHYEGRVHNRVVGITNAKVYSVRLNHYGYDLNQIQSRNKFERTVGLLKKDLADDPDNPITHHYLSCSYLSQAMFEETLSTSLRAIDLAEKQNNGSMLYLWSRYNAAMAFYRLKRFDKAEELALSGTNIFPKHIDAYFVLIMVYYEKKEWQRLIDVGREYLRLINLLKTSPEEFCNLVTCSLNEEWNIHVLVSIAYFELGREQESSDAFEEGVKSAPTPFVALRAAGIYFHNKNENENARKYLERARAECTDDSTVNSLLEMLSDLDRESTTTPTISCCMIVKDEEAFLTQCLESVKDHVDEIIIVDTGSTDGTVDIAQNYTAKIYFHPWEESFSKARNQALAYVTCDWVFQIDADEELVEGNGPRLRQAIRDADTADAILVNIISTYSNGKRVARHNFERLFKNNGTIHYEGIVHNRVVGATCIKSSKIELMHYGYDVEEKKSYEKFIRTTDLLKTQIEKNPDDPMPHHYLGTSYLSRSMHEDCARESTLAIDLAHRQHNNHPLYLWSHYNAAISFISLGNFDKAMYYSQQALDKFPDHLDSYFALTMVAAEENAWTDVLRYGEKYLQLHAFYSENPDKAGLVVNATLKEETTVHLFMGHAYHAGNDFISMKKAYQKSYAITDEKWELLWNIGIFHLDRSEDLELARIYLNRALDVSSSKPQVWYMLAKLNNKTGAYDEEKHCLEEFCTRDTTDAMALHRLASLYIDAGCNRQAIEVLNHILDNDRTAYRALCSLGSILKDEGEIDQAIEKFTTAAELNPQGLAPWIHMGDISMALNRYEEGRIFFERVLTLSPRHVLTLLSLCEIDVRQNRIVDLVQHCDLILSALTLDRNRTIHTMEDLVNILLDIKFALRTEPDATGKLEALLSLIPVDYDAVRQSLSTRTWQDADTDKKNFFLKTVSDISRVEFSAS